MTADEWISSPAGRGTLGMIAATALLLVVPAEWIRWLVTIRVAVFALTELKEACDQLPRDIEEAAQAALCRVMDNGQGGEAIVPEEAYPSAMVRKNVLESEDLNLESDD